MLVENHKQRLQESFRALTWAIDNDPTQNQQTVGYHISAIAVHLLNLHLHRENLLDTSSDLNDRRLRSERILEAALPFPFPRKDELVPLLVQVEQTRDPLCYGRPRSESEVTVALEAFGKLREIFRQLGVHER